jgi:flagellar hook protein FlgE
MGSALWIAISGLDASSRQMDVIGNNVANSNTMGFKAQRAEFANVLSQSLAGGASGPMQIGQGVTMANVATQFTQGSLESTGNALDLAIDGGGFFNVKDSTGSDFYTRAGAFHVDVDGYIVDINGNRVQGYGAGSASETLGDINTRSTQSAPSASTGLSVGLNLDDGTTVGGKYYSSQTVYDSLGESHVLLMTYEKMDGHGQWGVSATLDGDAVAAQSHDGIVFDSSGNLSKVYTGTPGESDYVEADPANITFTPAALSNGATIGDSGALTWYVTGDTSAGNTAETITGYASASTVNALWNDGYSAGSLRSMSFEKDGTITGYFTNGQTATLGQIALADFRDASGLKREGSNLFSMTLTSGPAIVNRPGDGGAGNVVSQSLEMANTDLGSEFINMMTAQRAYQANARVITTQDQLMTELMNLKR